MKYTLLLSLKSIKMLGCADDTNITGRSLGAVKGSRIIINYTKWT